MKLKKRAGMSWWIIPVVMLALNAFWPAAGAAIGNVLGVLGTVASLAGGGNAQVQTQDSGTSVPNQIYDYDLSTTFNSVEEQNAARAANGLLPVGTSTGTTGGGFLPSDQSVSEPTGTDTGSGGSIGAAEGYTDADGWHPFTSEQQRADYLQKQIDEYNQRRPPR